MPGESPGRDWDALLEPKPETLSEALAASRHKKRMRLWAVILVIVLGLWGLAWLAALPYALLIPHVGFLVWVLSPLPMLFIMVPLLRRLERLVVPQAERELELES
jgi:hypothetical protein